MKHLAPNGICLKALVLFSSIPGSAMAGFSKPLQDVPEHLGTGAMAIDHPWYLVGLIGLVVVVALLAGFYRRDK
jgi:hypothetical protein